EATGHLVDCISGGDPLWAVQAETLPGGKSTHGHDGVLYFGYVFPFRGVSSETLGDWPGVDTSSASRFPVDDMTSDATQLLGGRQSSSVSFATARAYYSLIRLNSYVYILGGTSGSGTVGTIERHVQ